VRWIEYTQTGSDFESGFLLYRVLRLTFPEPTPPAASRAFKLHLKTSTPGPRSRLASAVCTATLYYGPPIAHRRRKVCQRLA
jgi:hypothetical protein